jgi:succinate dehydrogenase / fumarate reductase flavoprotein subunit
LERRYPAFGNLVPRDVASRAAKERCDAGYGVGSTGLAVYLDFEDAIKRLGKDVVSSRYGNLFEMYEKITGENPYKMPMRIFPAVHYTMGGLWVDYDLMTTVPGLYAIGECNFSDHGANRLGASALMQGLADGYFVLPYTLGKYLSEDIRTPAISTDHEEFEKAEKKTKDQVKRLLENNGNRSVESYHRELGKIVWDYCGMSRNKKELKSAIEEIKVIKNDFWNNVLVPGEDNVINPELTKAGRVADFIELGELMMRDALARDESCGGHFREEHQTGEGEAMRDDAKFAFTSAWEFNSENKDPILNKEVLEFENVQLTQRSYK